jgi:hypothetical protein
MRGPEWHFGPGENPQVATRAIVWIMLATAGSLILFVAILAILFPDRLTSGLVPPHPFPQPQVNGRQRQERIQLQNEQNQALEDKPAPADGIADAMDSIAGRGAAAYDASNAGARAP